jgi:hypothetical protein
MARITLAEAQAWAETSKMDLSDFGGLDLNLLTQVEAQVLGDLGRVYDPALIQYLWVNEMTTPQLVRTLIAMRYVSLLYDRQYSEDEGRNPWARRLENMANDLTESITTGNVDIPEVAGVVGVARSPLFYPTDASSEETGPTAEDPSAGPPQFTMGMPL